MFAGTTARQTPFRSPRATSVLNTLSAGSPILRATVSASKTAGSTSYSRNSYRTPIVSSSRTALVFMLFSVTHQIGIKSVLTLP